MTASPALADGWQAAFEEVRSAGAPWLEARRASAFERFRELGFPTRRDEDWRHTDLSGVTRTRWVPAPAPSARDIEAADALIARHPMPAEEGMRVVFVNGHHAPSLSRGAPAAGIRVASLAETDDALEPRLATLIDGEPHAFAALNTALWQDGVYVHVGRNADAEQPIHLLFVAVSGEVATVVHPRMLLVCETGGRASVVVSWAAEAAGPLLDNAALEVWLEPNARLDLLALQELPYGVQHFETLRVHQARDSHFTSCCVNRGAKLARSDVTVKLDDEGAECRVDGITIVSGRQHVDVQTTIDHAEPHGTSHQLYKGILDDHATTAFSGLVLVRPHAQKTDAQQANHNLLLSRDAVADSKPQLEIFADDVKCAHGATVGELDEDALFYLRSRGLDAEQARAMLVKAFAWEVAERVERESLRAHLRTILEAAL